MAKTSNFDEIARIGAKSKVGKKNALRGKSTRSRGYEIPDWYGKIKPSKGHGSGVIQQRAWRVVSEYVRQRDWKLGCVSCGVKFEHWQDSQAGHFIPWSTCHGMYKYDLENLSAQCMSCNAWGGASAGHNYAIELEKRRGKEIVTALQIENERHRGEKLEAWMLVEMVAKLAPHLVQ